MVTAAKTTDEASNPSVPGSGTGEGGPYEVPEIPVSVHWAMVKSDSRTTAVNAKDRYNGLLLTKAANPGPGTPLGVLRAANVGSTIVVGVGNEINPKLTYNTLYRPETDV